MDSTNKTCGKCHRSSSHGDGWYTVHDHTKNPVEIYSMCPMCYKNLALINQREAMIEAIERIRLGHSDPGVSVGMRMMKDWCINAIKDAPYEGS